MKQCTVKQARTVPSRLIGWNAVPVSAPSARSFSNKSYYFELNKQIGERDRDWKELLKFFEAEGGNFSGMNYATTVSKLGRFKGRDLSAMRKDKRYPNLIKSLEKVMTSSPLSEFGQGARHVANAVHGLAKMNQPNKAIMSKVNEEAEWMVTTGVPQAIANTAWSFASMDVKAPELFEEIEKQAPRIVKEGAPQAIANTAWAAATLGHWAPALFKEIETRASFLVKDGKPQEIANTAWAAATLGHSASALFEAIETRSSFLVKEGKPQEIANTAWAAATLGHSAPALFREIEARSSFLAKEGTPQAIANTVWAYGKLQYDAPTLLAAVDSASEVLIKSGTTQSFANVALAFAEIGHKPASFFNCLEMHSDELVKSANEQQITNVSWSLVTLGIASENEALLQALWKRAIETDASKFTSEALNQLVQVDVHARASGVELPPVSPSLKKRMSQAAKADTNAGSRFEDKYSALLTEAGFKHDREVQFLEGDYAGFLAIDFACKERKIAVEFDGPSHYLTELKKGAKPNHGRENGRTTAKRRLMEQMGWKVVNIDYKDNIKLSTAPKEKVEKAGGMKEMKIKYLRNRLKLVGVIL